MEISIKLTEESWVDVKVEFTESKEDYSTRTALPSKSSPHRLYKLVPRARELLRD